MSTDAGEPRLGVKISKTPRPEVEVEVKAPPLCLCGRRAKVRVIVRNEKIMNIPKEITS